MQNTIEHLQRSITLNSEILDYLKDFSRNIDHEYLYLAIVESGPKTVKQLLSLRFPIDLRDENEKTLLLTSTEFSTDKSSVYLINQGANVNSINENGVSVFLNASTGNNFELLNLLLLKGANINHGMCNNLNPIDYALHSNMTLEKYKYLKKNGAKSNFSFFWTLKELLSKNIIFDQCASETMTVL